MKLARRANGFTLIELIVVIAVIGILAAITVFGFTRFQEDGRDAQRSASVSTIVESLEKYFDENGEYPSCTAITAPAATVVTTLPDITPETLVAPGESAADNSLKCETLTIEGDDFFEYQGDGSETCLTGGSCLSYTLRYKEESEDSIASVSSRRNTDAATSGAPVLTVSSLSFTTINLSWTPVLNAANYRVQISANSTFDGSDPTFEQPQTTYQASGLSDGTQYWIRVQALFVGDVAGQYSNTVSPTTDTLNASSLVATANSNSQITVTWGAIAGAATYTLYQATSTSGGNLVSPTVISGITGTSSVRTGLSTGVTYYYQVKGVNGAVESELSNIGSATTFVPAPATITATTNSSTQITVNWATVSVATSYTLQHSASSSFTSPTTVTGITGTSQVVTGLTQGQTRYFRVYALVGAVSSNSPSPTANATTTVNTPGTPSMGAYTPGTVRPYASGYWVNFSNSPQSGNWYFSYGSASGSCPSGTSIQYNFSAQYSSPTTLYNTGWTGTGTWYMVRPNSPYKVKFLAQVRCVGANATSAASGQNQACASNTGSNVSCF